MILNGIDEIVGRGDLIDRCIFLHLPTISDKRRRLESAFWLEFEAASPRLLGALLTAVSGGLSMLLAGQFAGLAAHGRFRPMGGGRRSWPGLATRGLPGGSTTPIAGRPALPSWKTARSPLRPAEMMDGARGTYRGTASMLLEGLGSMTPAEITRSAQWPKTPRLFARILRRIAPQLRLIGINIRFDRRPNAREIKIWNVRDVERPATAEARPPALRDLDPVRSPRSRPDLQRCPPCGKHLGSSVEQSRCGGDIASTFLARVVKITQTPRLPCLAVIIVPMPAYNSVRFGAPRSHGGRVGARCSGASDRWSAASG